MNKNIYRILFYVILFLITYLFYIFPFETLNKLLLNHSQSLQYSLINTLIFYILILYYLRSHNTFKPLKIFVYEGLGIGFISFMTLSICVIFNSILQINTFFLGIISLILIILIYLFGSYNARTISIKEIDIKSSNITKNHQILFISDVHLGTNNKKHLVKIMKKINKVKFDFLLIGGDLIDSSSFNLKDLNIIKEINKPIYFVSGNHEYYLKGYQNKIGQLSSFNIKHLKNARIEIDGINLIGIDDNQTESSKIHCANKLHDNNLFNLFVCHKPDIWQKLNCKNYLMLSGHTHNGQIFPFNFIVKLKFKYIYGLYNKNNSNLYVSSGVACWGPKVRLGSKNEIVHLKLEKI